MKGIFLFFSWAPKKQIQVVYPQDEIAKIFDQSIIPIIPFKWILRLLVAILGPEPLPAVLHQWAQ